MLTLSIPPRRDPVARGVLLSLIMLVAWAAIARPGVESVQAQNDAQIIILDATPTAAIPTPAISAPELALIGATPESVVYTPAQLPAPDWPAAPIAVHVPAPDPAYLANVGAQAPHSPRGDVVHAPSHQSGPIQYTDTEGAYIIEPIAPAVPAIAVAGPGPLSDAQRAVLAARESHGCATGEVFYPRTGCHLPGSGGAMPGAVGEP